MNKQIEKIKIKLAELAVVVNAFNSEDVQVKVIDRLLQVMMDSVDGSNFFAKEGGQLRIDPRSSLLAEPKKPGATKLLNELFATDFFINSEQRLQ